MDGIVQSTDLDDDMVGPSLEGTKLRSNVYRTENANWQDIDVRGLYDFFLNQDNNIKRFNISSYFDFKFSI